jgi:ADP-dependent NAD(P)H-hydrate dehydratase / NAD(P)H-hydrate epimerase
VKKLAAHLFATPSDNLSTYIFKWGCTMRYGPIFIIFISMKLFTAQQIREADAFTIAQTPISSTGLMEHAANACTNWIYHHYPIDTPVAVYCGTGNNGGDGLAITRLLRDIGYNAHAYILRGDKVSPDNEANKVALQEKYPDALSGINLTDNTLVIDALFGTGLNRPVTGEAAELIAYLNEQPNTVISIDMPSGLQTDQSSLGMPAIKADHTLSFEFYKLAFLLPENAEYIGQVHILPIGLLYNATSRYQVTDLPLIKSIYKPRLPFSHKGTYGHALLVAGSEGKMGAAVLSAKACLRGGVGLLTCHVPRCGYNIIQIAAPEAMCILDKETTHSTDFYDNTDKYKVIGIGPGIGTDSATAQALRKLLEQYHQPMVIDADALNIIAQEQMLDLIPKGSLLTPHPKEFERLFGKTDNDVARLELLSAKAVELGLCILLKGRYTAMAFPDGSISFNATGNAGMATGGSGDVLTGILTSLVAQGYTSEQAMLLGVYIHGRAGDHAAAVVSEEALIAEDLVFYLGFTYLELKK